MDSDVTGEELDRGVRRELTTLRAEAAEAVAQHLVMAARRLEEDDGDGAYQHAQAARRLGQRVGVIREAMGLVAYRTGRYAEALAELRAARRIAGIDEHLPVMADCERALGRPERALEMAAAGEVQRYGAAVRAEMRIVAAGARADLGQHEAAVVTLQAPELSAEITAPWLARLRYAYAEALERVDRHDEARHWLGRAAQADPEGETGAFERLQTLDVEFLTDEDWTEAHAPGEDAAGEHVTGEHATGEHATEAYAVGEHPAGEHATEAYAAGEHVTGEHATEAYAAGEHATVAYAAGEHATGEHAGEEYPHVERAAGEHPTEDSPGEGSIRGLADG